MNHLLAPNILHSILLGYVTSSKWFSQIETNLKRQTIGVFNAFKDKVERDLHAAGKALVCNRVTLTPKTHFPSVGYLPNSK